MNHPAAELRGIEIISYICHSGSSRIFLQKDSRQAGVTDKRIMTIPRSRAARNSLIKLVSTDAKDGLCLEEEDYIFCRNCGNRVTTLDNIIAVDGQHKHTFTSPPEIIYEIGCFSSAAGCFVYGEQTFDFTWFEGFSWSLTFCSRCIFHLGWYYQSSGLYFFGLILDHLVEKIQTH